MADRSNRENYYARERDYSTGELQRHCAAVHSSDRPVDGCTDCAHLDSRIRAARRREIEKGGR